MVIAIALVQWRLHMPLKDNNSQLSKWDKLRRVDFVGAFFLCLVIFSICLILDTGGDRIPWDSPLMIGLAVAAATCLFAYLLSARLVAEPIFPLRLLTHYAVVTNYIVITLQVMVQMSLMMAVPLYFQATKSVSTAAAGAYLLPAFAGNTLGGLLSGYWIKKTGDYKAPTVLSPALAILCMTLILLRWNEHTSVAESLYTFFGGFGTGMASSSAFVGLVAGVKESEIAIAGSGMYLCFNFGAIAGVSAGSAVYQNTLESGL